MDMIVWNAYERRYYSVALCPETVEVLNANQDEQMGNCVIRFRADWIKLEKYAKPFPDDEVAPKILHG